MASRNLTTETSVDESMTYLKSLQLAGPKFKLLQPLWKQPVGTVFAKESSPEDDKKQAYVVGKALTAFTANVTGSAKQDVLDSTLFAQLAADKEHNQQEDMQNWYNTYLKTLDNLGFVEIKYLDFVEFDAKGATITMDKVVMDSMNKTAPGAEAAITQQTLKAFSALPDSDHRVSIFNEQTLNASSGSFQIYPCEQTAPDNVSVVMGAFYFHAECTESDVLFADWSARNTHLFKCTNKVMMDLTRYARSRAYVSMKLEMSARSLIAAIDLP